MITFFFFMSMTPKKTKRLHYNLNGVYILNFIVAKQSRGKRPNVYEFKRTKYKLVGNNLETIFG